MSALCLSSYLINSIWEVHTETQIGSLYTGLKKVWHFSCLNLNLKNKQVAKLSPSHITVKMSDPLPYEVAMHVKGGSRTGAPGPPPPPFEIPGSATACIFADTGPWPEKNLISYSEAFHLKIANSLNIFQFEIALKKYQSHSLCRASSRCFACQEFLQTFHGGIPSCLMGIKLKFLKIAK